MIYFIRNTGDGSIKIGYSDDPEARLRQLQTANAHKLELLGSIPGGVEQEKAIHGILAAHQMEGEWFRDHPHVTAFIGIATGIARPAQADDSALDRVAVWDVDVSVGSASSRRFYALTPGADVLPEVPDFVREHYRGLAVEVRSVSLIGNADGASRWVYMSDCDLGVSNQSGVPLGRHAAFALIKFGIDMILKDDEIRVLRDHIGGLENRINDLQAAPPGRKPTLSPIHANGHTNGTIELTT